ncbi:MAG: phage portal protein, partial [Ruminococcus sp.]|nr:phage portal protein [Ruminococcus sp.]
VNDIAEIADKFMRNEIMTSNEIRQIIDMKPVDDPSTDELRNKNLSAPSASESSGVSEIDDEENPVVEGGKIQNEAI